MVLDVHVAPLCKKASFGLTTANVALSLGGWLAAGGPQADSLAEKVYTPCPITS